MKIKKDFIIQQIGDSYLAIAVGKTAESFRRLVRLNGSGAFLWNYIAEESHTEEEMVLTYTEHYSVSREVAEEDVSRFIATARENGIIYEDQ